MQKKVLIFDLDDTLLDFKKGEALGLKKVFETFQVAPLDYENWLATYLAINKQTWTKIEQGMASQPLLDTRFSKTFAEFGQEIDGMLAEAFYRTQLDQNDALILGADELLQELKQAGYHVIAGTNGKTATQYTRLSLTGLTDFFDHIVISDEIGIAKPSPDFFDHIFHLMPDFTKDDFMMIGDSLRSDILGAQQAMIDSIWFNPAHQENHSAILPTYTVDSIDALRKLLLA